MQGLPPTEKKGKENWSFPNKNLEGKRSYKVLEDSTHHDENEEGRPMTA